MINTSIKFPLTISLSSKDHNKIKSFEKTLKHLDLVSNYEVLFFNNENIFYKVIYNGSPDKLLDEIKETVLNLKKNNQTWTIQRKI